MGLLVTPLKFSIAVLAMVVGLALSASAQSDRRLLQKTSLDFDNATIGDVLKELAERHKLTLALSPKVTERECDQKKVMVHVAGTTLGSALNRLRAVSPLVFAVDRGELKVVLQEEDDERLYSVRYPTIGWGPLVEDVDSFKSGLMGVTGLRWKEIDGRGEPVIFSPVRFTRFFGGRYNGRHESTRPPSQVCSRRPPVSTRGSPSGPHRDAVAR